MMNQLVIIIEVGILVVIILLGLYDWFYTNGIRRLTNQWGIIFPPVVKKLISLNVKVTLFAIVLLILLIMYSLYSYFGNRG